jgi:hypothetical protein
MRCGVLRLACIIAADFTWRDDRVIIFCAAIPSPAPKRCKAARQAFSEAHQSDLGCPVSPCRNIRLLDADDPQSGY